MSMSVLVEETETGEVEINEQAVDDYLDWQRELVLAEQDRLMTEREATVGLEWDDYSEVY